MVLGGAEDVLIVGSGPFYDSAGECVFPYWGTEFGWEIWEESKRRLGRPGWWRR